MHYNVLNFIFKHLQIFTSELDFEVRFCLTYEPSVQGQPCDALTSWDGVNMNSVAMIHYFHVNTYLIWENVAILKLTK